MVLPLNLTSFDKLLCVSLLSFFHSAKYENYALNTFRDRNLSTPPRKFLNFLLDMTCIKLKNLFFKFAELIEYIEEYDYDKYLTIIMKKKLTKVLKQIRKILDTLPKGQMVIYIFFIQ